MATQRHFEIGLIQGGFKTTQRARITHMLNSLSYELNCTGGSVDSDRDM